MTDTVVGAAGAELLFDGPGDEYAGAGSACEDGDDDTCVGWVD